jgi:hypothetical protein
LYTRAYDIRFSRRLGTYLGHAKELEDAKRGLNKLIEEAEGRGCPVDQATKAWARIPAPQQPAGIKGPPNNLGK